VCGYTIESSSHVAHDGSDFVTLFPSTITTIIDDFTDRFDP
jgi:hypothetical protein